MTPLERILKIVGSRPKLARIIGTHPTNVDHWQRPASPKRRPDLPPKYNEPLVKYARDHYTPEQIAEIDAALTHACPHCGRPY